MMKISSHQYHLGIPVISIGSEYKGITPILYHRGLLPLALPQCFRICDVAPGTYAIGGPVCAAYISNMEVFYAVGNAVYKPMPVDAGTFYVCTSNPMAILRYLSPVYAELRPGFMTLYCDPHKVFHTTRLPSAIYKAILTSVARVVLAISGQSVLDLLGSQTLDCLRVCTDGTNYFGLESFINSIEYMRNENPGSVADASKFFGFGFSTEIAIPSETLMMGTCNMVDLRISPGRYIPPLQVHESPYAISQPKTFDALQAEAHFGIDLTKVLVADGLDDVLELFVTRKQPRLTVDEWASRKTSEYRKFASELAVTPAQFNTIEDTLANALRSFLNLIYDRHI